MMRCRSLQAILQVRLLIIGVIVAFFGGTIVYLRFSLTIEHELALRARSLANIVCISAESFTKVSSLRRFVSAISADREVDGIAIAAGDPAIIVASSKPAWVGRQLQSLPQETPEISALRSVLSTGRTISGRLERDTFKFSFAAPTQTYVGYRDGWLARGAVVVTLKPELVQSEMQQHVAQITVITAMIVCAVLAGVYSLIRSRVLHPIHRIAKYIESYEKGIVPRTKIDNMSGDELGILARTLGDAFSALAEKERQFRSLVDNIPGVPYRCTYDDRQIIFLSSAIENLTGYPSSDFVIHGSRTYHSIIHPDDQASTLATMTAGLTAKGSYIVDYRILHADGHEIWVCEKAQIVYNHDGRPLWLDGFIFDQSERKRFAAARLRALHDLRDSEERHRSVVDNALDAVVTMNEGGQIVGWNSQAEQIFGWSRDEAIGRLLADTVIPEGMRSAHTRGVSNYINTREAKLFNKRLEVTAVRKNGVEFPCELAITPISIRGAQLFTAFLRDITKRRAAEEEIHRHRDHLQDLVDEKTRDLLVAKDSAEQANQAKSEFLANMSHELRTPMHAILSFAKLGREKAPAVPLEKVQHYFDAIATSGTRLMHLLNDLLDLAKLESRNFSLDADIHDLIDSVSAVTNEMIPLANERGITINVHNEAMDTNIWCDIERMIQVVRNLLGNAIKFSAVGSAIDITLVDSELPSANDTQMTPAVALAVSDSGIGIPESELNTIFDKFVQSSKTRNGAGGTGLGLAICQEIVVAHQGTINAANNSDHGAVFTVTLPRRPRAA